MSIKPDFTGKVAIVTCSSSGVGAAIAIALARAGARVVISGRYALKVNAVANECHKVSPNKLKPIEVMVDMLRPEDLQRLIRQTIERHNRLDILVNCCNLKAMTRFTDNDFMDKYRQTLDLNLHSLVYLTHLCVPHLEQTRGTIVNISTIGAYATFTEYTPNCMAKSALNMFTECMASDLATKGIRVNSVNHGPIIDYQFTENGGRRRPKPRKRKHIEADAVSEAYGRQCPAGRAGTGMDVSNAVLYLASDNASFVTGVHHVIDGGHLAAGLTPIVKIVN
ncbi:uncharacterized oxidoreductase SSP0419-like [Oppia nitens]|uniref:uncharacterized oxidoreductase SSP0419-like n=1 Tax=Oppia nitens TaxID=1686743 RepID=UPI0023DA9DCB|nr:uncharacterized oxidoreductase SSP0419-like [Oppia nitens]